MGKMLWTSVSGSFYQWMDKIFSCYRQEWSFHPGGDSKTITELKSGLKTSVTILVMNTTCLLDGSVNNVGNWNKNRGYELSVFQIAVLISLPALDCDRLRANPIQMAWVTSKKDTAPGSTCWHDTNVTNSSLTHSVQKIKSITCAHVQKRKTACRRDKTENHSDINGRCKGTWA